jgi:hypothetical protein
MLALLLQSSGFLQLFIDSCEDEGCEETALNWVLAAVVVAITCALLMLGVKWFKKYAAINLIQKSVEPRSDGSSNHRRSVSGLNRAPNHLVYDPKFLQLRRYGRTAKGSGIRLAVVCGDDVYRTSAESMA